MADLMNGSYVFSMLEAKYGKFMVPAIKIKVNGTDIVGGQKLTVTDLTVSLVLDGCSSAIFKIADQYNPESHSFPSSLKSKLKLGTVVEIEVGYLSFTEAVFKGYIEAVGCEFSEEEIPSLVVRCMDARRLMMTSGKKQVIYDVKNYSDAFSTVMKSYSKLCSPVTEATKDILTKPISQTTSDYNFVSRELLRRGKSEREFFILGDKAYFRTPAKNTSPVMKVEFGRELLDFRMMSGYLDMKIVVSGYDPVNQKSIKAESAAKSDGSQTSVLSPAPEVYFIDPDADSSEKAKTRAEMYARQEKDAVKSAEGTLVGLPEIVPGRYLEIKDLEGMVNKKYYLTEVTHRIVNDSFTTSFEAGGWL